MQCSVQCGVKCKECSAQCSGGSADQYSGVECSAVQCNSSSVWSAVLSAVEGVQSSIVECSAVLSAVWSGVEGVQWSAVECIAVPSLSADSTAQLALVHAAAPMSSAPINTVSERVRGYKELPSGRGSMPAAHIAQNQLSGAAHSRLPTSNTNRARPKVLHRTVTANSSCPITQVVCCNLLWCRKNHVPK